MAIYHDYAETHLGKSPGGQMSGTRIDLHPVVRFDTGFSVRDERPAKMQDRAHRDCCIANTLADSIEINILWGPEMSHFFCASHGRVAPVRGGA